MTSAVGPCRPVCLCACRSCRVLPSNKHLLEGFAYLLVCHSCTHYPWG